LTIKESIRRKGTFQEVLNIVNLTFFTPQIYLVEYFFLLLKHSVTMNFDQNEKEVLNRIILEINTFLMKKNLEAPKKE